MIYFLSLKPETPNRDYWDMALIEDILQDEKQEVSTLPECETATVVIPARHHAGLENEIDTELKKIKNATLYLMGDEEGDFAVEKIKHANEIWVQNPIYGRHDKYKKLGTGYTPHVSKYEELPNKTLDFFFAGQITHERRVEMAKNIPEGGETVFTKGFTQGLKPEEYVKKMASAKIVPCPSGPKTVDSFRLFEALELGCIPIADTQTPDEDWEGFWDWLFEEAVPFPQIKDWESLPGYIAELKNQYPVLNNRIQAWWIRYKHKIRPKKGNMTIVIPISPIKSHPDTFILDETIASLPEATIYLTFDGVREEQENMRENYEEHIRRVLWKYRKKDIVPIIFEEHEHQIGMMRAIIDQIETPLILYIEQDAPLTGDIPFEKLSNEILSGNSNMIRFHFEAHIPKEHEHLMIGKPENDLLKTAQWSQRPHLASTAFYKRIMNENFSPNAKCFIEDLLHGKLMQDYVRFKEQGWNQWRVHIYHPKGNIKRSYTTDGRAGEEKYGKDQIW